MVLIKKRFWVLFTFILFLLLVLTAVPAAWVIYGLQQVAPGFQANNVSGTVWNGKATYSQWVGGGKVLPFGQLSWDLSFWSLLAINPCLNFATRAAGQVISGQICYSAFSGLVRAEGLEIRLPVGVITPFFTIEADGAVDAFVTRASWLDNQLGDTEFTVLWQDASIYNGSQWVPLGNIQGKGNDDKKGGLVSQWKSTQTPGESAPATISLEARLTNLHQKTPNMRITGNINPGSSAQTLTPMLRFVGEPERNGSYRIDINE